MTMASPEAQPRLGLIFVAPASLMLIAEPLLGANVFSLLNRFLLDIPDRYNAAGVSRLRGVLELILGVGV